MAFEAWIPVGCGSTTSTGPMTRTAPVFAVGALAGSAEMPIFTVPRLTGVGWFDLRPWPPPGTGTYRCRIAADWRINNAARTGVEGWSYREQAADKTGK